MTENSEEDLLWTKMMMHDWYVIPVENGDGVYRKVDGFFYGEIITHMHMQPIPLTEEILRINNFELSHESEYRKEFTLWTDDEEFCFTVKFSKIGNPTTFTISGTKVPHVIIPIVHVHELQQALRLCHFDSIANNIEIKPKVNGTE